MTNDNKTEQTMLITQAILPTLAAGKYQLHATGKIATGEQDKPERVFPADIVFYVHGPRFKLGEGDIYSCYPTEPGDYSKTLPNIVFNGRTLPWDRGFGPRNAQGMQAPWLALLLLDEDEIKQNDLKVALMTVDEIRNNTGIALPPTLPHDPNEDDESGTEPGKKSTYPVIEVTCKLLKDIMPGENELPLLAHARQVDTKDKETPQVDNNGWYSVVIGNRLPTPNKKNTVFLVSVEGHENNITQAALAKTSDGNKKVRLITLASWQFDCEGEDFETIVKNIAENTGPLAVTYDSQKITNDKIKTALNYGYTALNHEYRNGGKTISWFRGPLAPVSINKPTPRNFVDADAALRFDKETAMFDVSYSSAWQLGRILALQQPGFMHTVQNWKKTYQNTFRLKLAQSLLKNQFPNSFSFLKNDILKEYHTVETEEKVMFNDAVDTTERDEFLGSLMAELWTKLKF